MYKALIVILFSFVFTLTMLPSGSFLLDKLNVVEMLNNDEEKNKSVENEDLDGEEKEDVQEKQLFFESQFPELLFDCSITQVIDDYIEGNYSYALKIQLPPPEFHV